MMYHIKLLSRLGEYIKKNKKKVRGKEKMRKSTIKATYWMGQNIGKSKKTGEPLYILNFLCMNTWYSMQIRPLFVDEDTYNLYLESDFELGDAVKVNTTMGGILESIEHDARYAPLNWDAPPVVATDKK